MDIEIQNKMYLKEILGLRKRLESEKEKIKDLEKLNEQLVKKLRSRDVRIFQQGNNISKLKSLISK